MELKRKQAKLKRLRTRNIVLNLICILLAGSGLWWTADYFWRYINYEVTNEDIKKNLENVQKII